MRGLRLADREPVPFPRQPRHHRPSLPADRASTGRGRHLIGRLGAVLRACDADLRAPRRRARAAAKGPPGTWRLCDDDATMGDHLLAQTGLVRRPRLRRRRGAGREVRSEHLEGAGVAGGRATGEWRGVPVNLPTLGEARYLGAVRGETAWALNLRPPGRESSSSGEGGAVCRGGTGGPRQVRDPACPLQALGGGGRRFLRLAKAKSPDEDLRRVAPSTRCSGSSRRPEPTDATQVLSSGRGRG